MNQDVTLHPPDDVPLTAQEIGYLDRLLRFLQTAMPPFESYSSDACSTCAQTGLFDEAASRKKGSPILAVCGNWYDVVHKAPFLARLALEAPQGDILLTGGRAERLTPARAEAVGGEPLLLQQTLISDFEIDPRRIIVYTGSRVSNHNLRTMIFYAKQVKEFSQRMSQVTIIEEAFLVRRLAAGLAVQLRGDAEASDAISSFRFVAVGSTSFRTLLAAHGGREAIALALLFGEIDRLKKYSSAGTTTTATHGTVSRGPVCCDEALEGLEPDLMEALEAMRGKHAALLTAGKHVLEVMPRSEMLPIAEPFPHVAPDKRHGRNKIPSAAPY